MRILLFSIIGSLFFTTTALAQTTHFSSEKSFTDIPVQSSDFKAIEYLGTKNVVRGYGEMAQIAYRLVENDTQQPSMAFNKPRNTLSQRSYIAPMKPDLPMPLTAFSRPSARSIHLLSNARNELRIIGRQ